MAHTPKPIRKASKAARRQRGPGHPGYGRSVRIDEMWTMVAPESGRARIVDLSRSSRLYREPLDPFNLLPRGRSTGSGMPIGWQYPSDFGQEYHDLIEGHGGKLINMQSLRDREE